MHALNGLAIFATSPDPAIREGVKAVSYATRLCQLSKWQEKNTLDTLAAAYAEAGRFDLALTWQQKALGTPPDKDMLARLALYEHHQPYRDK